MVISSLCRHTWKQLVGSHASFQHNCNKEVFNAVEGKSLPSKARVGIIANEHNDGSSCDFRIGFVTGSLHDDSYTCGNEATRASDKWKQAWDTSRWSDRGHS